MKGIERREGWRSRARVERVSSSRGRNEGDGNRGSHDSGAHSGDESQVPCPPRRRNMKRQPPSPRFAGNLAQQVQLLGLDLVRREMDERWEEVLIGHG